MCLVVIFEILGLFVKKLNVDDKYSLCNRDNFLQPIQMRLSKKPIFFLNWLKKFWNFHQILNILKQTVTLITCLFLKLQTATDVVRQNSKKIRFRKPFES